MIDADAVLVYAFPDRTVASVETVRRGNNKATAVVRFADGETVVLQRSARPDALRTEVALARAIADRTDIPVPTVRDSGSLDGTGYAVLGHAAGDDLHERFAGLGPERQAAIARTFGRALGQLHEAFRFDAPGPVSYDADTDSFRATGTNDWPASFASYAREGIDALPEAFADLRGPIQDTLDDAALPATPSFRLYPWDLRPGNALLADGEVTAILDWGDPLAAAPGLSLAKTEHLVADWYVEDGDPLRDALRAGYRSVRPLPAVPRLYRIVAVVRSAVDSRGEVTRPRYPELTGDDAVAFHRERLETLL